MSTSCNVEKTRARPIADDEDWVAFLEPDLCRDPASVDSLAHLLFRIKEAVSSGPEGIKAASDTLLDGIRLAFLYTKTHKAALELYLLSLTGHLKPQDEPL